MAEALTKSPSNKAAQRQAMYKVSTPPWKETYRKVSKYTFKFLIKNKYEHKIFDICFCFPVVFQSRWFS